MSMFNVDRYLAASDTAFFYYLELDEPCEEERSVACLFVSKAEEALDGDGEEFHSFAALRRGLKAMRPEIVDVAFDDDFDYSAAHQRVVVRQLREYGKLLGFKVRFTV